MSAVSSQTFGLPSDCTTLGQVTTLIASSPDLPELRRHAAAFGMFLAASGAVGHNSLFEDTRYVLEELSRAKAEIDLASRHDSEIIHITTAILNAGQAFVSETTLPCTEWPTPSEVAEVALKAARSQVPAQT